MRFTTTTLLLLCVFCIATAQEQTIIASRTAKITIDGALNEPVWQNNLAVTHFIESIPVDTGLAANQTIVRLAFDDTYLYVGATCYQPRSSYLVESLKRDFAGGTSDVLNIAINPFRDGVNGFIFGVNPYGVMREALMDNGNNMSFDWDNKWNAEVQRFDDHWTVEMAIPFRTLRYKTNEANEGWRVNFIRTTLKPWNVSTWVRVPRPFAPQALAFSGELQWEQAPPPARRFGTSVIPYVIGKYETEYKRDATTLAVIDRPQRYLGNIGGDIKVGLTPSLNLDLTLNPDFSQVEVDRQVANLSRFELFFPELRQFFQENRDLFAFWGFPNTRPFFSRRIGLAYNPVAGRNEQVPIVGGARLSGKLNNNWRIGLLNMQTRQREWSADQILPAANFTVATAQRKVLARSFVGGFLTNKQNLIGNLSELQKSGIQPWQRNAGLEYNLYSKDSRWEGEWYYHRSFSPDAAKRDHAFAQFFGYNSRLYSIRTGYNHIGKRYTADAGFVPRQGIQSVFLSGGRSIYFEKGFMSQIEFGANSSNTFLLDGKRTDGSQTVSVNCSQRNGGVLEWSAARDFTYLLSPFDPTNLNAEGSTPLPAQQGYKYWYSNLTWASARNRQLYGLGTVEVGQYFNGHKQTINAEINARWQPFGIFTLAGVYNRIKLPQPYPSADFWLVGPRVELTFTKSVFFNAFFQYNTQANNFNVNTRIQWRFAPVSDFFLVYTDNSYAEGIPNTDARFLAPKNRALVAKLTYWY